MNKKNQIDYSNCYDKVNIIGWKSFNKLKLIEEGTVCYDYPDGTLMWCDNYKVGEGPHSLSELIQITKDKGNMKASEQFKKLYMSNNKKMKH